MSTASAAPTLLVLGAGRGQVGLYRAARDLGLRTVAVTLPGAGLPGLALADDVQHADLRDPEAVAEVALRVRPDGIATSCMDTAVPALGAAVEATGLRGLSRAAADLCLDKAAMKAALARAGVPTPRHLEVRSEEDLEQACRTLRLPVMVKATDLQGSLGVIRADSPEEARTAYLEARGLSREDVLLVEEFVEGVELGAQALVSDGQVRFVMLHDDQVVTAAGTTVPVGHSIPFTGSPQLAATATRVVEDAVRALGLDDCAVNVDLITDADGGVHVIELTGRAGANGLPELTSSYLGQDYYRVIVDLALGRELTLDAASTAAAVRMLHQHEHEGRLRTITFDPALQEQVDLTLFVAEGSEVRPFRSSNDCLGQAHTVGHDVAECHARLDAFERSMRLTVSEAGS